MMSRSDDLLVRITGRVVQLLRILNAATVLFVLAALVTTFAAEPRLSAILLAKYGSGADLPAMLLLLRVMMASILPAALVVERLFGALGAIVEHVRDGTPFAPDNAGHLRTIGWMLLAMQLLDLGFGLLTYWGTRIGVDVATWHPSVTGWLAVLVAFVLVRVFAAGAAMREDLAGTI